MVVIRVASCVRWNSCFISRLVYSNPLIDPSPPLAFTAHQPKSCRRLLCSRRGKRFPSCGRGRSRNPDAAEGREKLVSHPLDTPQIFRPVDVQQSVACAARPDLCAERSIWFVDWLRVGSVQLDSALLRGGAAGATRVDWWERHRSKRRWKILSREWRGREVFPQATPFPEDCYFATSGGRSSVTLPCSCL